MSTLVFVRFADEWFTFFPAGALAPIRDDLHLSYAQAGLVLAALPAGGLLGHGLKVAGDFVDRRWLASLGALGYGLCMLAFAAGDSFPLLVVASLLWGMASDALIAGCELTLIDAARDELALVLARVNAYGAAGDLLGPLTLAATAAAGVGWRGVFAGGGALMLLYAAALASRPFPKPRPPAHAATPWASVRSVLRDRRVLLLAVVAGLFGLLDEPLLGFTIAYLEQVRHLSATLATAIAAVAVSGGLAGYLSVSRFTGRWTARPLLLGGGMAVGLCVAGIVVAPVAPLAALAGFGFGFSGAVFYSVLQAAYLSLRPGQAGATDAVVSTIGLAGIGFPPLVGAVSDRAGLTAGLALYTAVPIVMLGLLAAGWGGLRTED